MANYIDLQYISPDSFSFNLDRYSSDQIAYWIVQLHRIVGPQVHSEPAYHAAIREFPRRQLIAIFRDMQEKREALRRRRRVETEREKRKQYIEQQKKIVEMIENRNKKRYEGERQKDLQELSGTRLTCPQCKEPDSIIDGRCYKCDFQVM